jgi:hypothetical protein
LSRLFESSGDDADEAAFPILPLADAEALADVLRADGESSLLDDAVFGEAVALDAAETAVAAVSEEPAGEPVRIDPLDYEIPDFEKDAREVTAYDEAKKRHLRQAIASAETTIQASFKAKRTQLTAEIRAARSFEEERRASAMHTTRVYANAYPRRVDKRGVNPPSFWENVLSLGRAGRLYREASLATEALEQLRATMRKREEQLSQLEGQMERAIVLKEEALKKAAETEAGIAEFHARPEVEALYRRVQRIHKERETYAKRLERGEVGQEEQRDRAMSEFNLSYAELPLMGVIIAKVARFGSLSYFQLRDLTKKETLLSYDPRLDPLRNSVFDVYSVANAVAAKLKRNDNGTAYRVADHFKACWRNQEQAEELYGQHRAALREERGLPTMPPRDENEAEIIERLATLAMAVDGGQARETATHVVVPSSARP